MNQSPSIASLAAALAKANLVIGPAAKASINQDFGSRYADIAATIEACKKPLAEHGISVLQPVSGGPLEYSITTMLLHESGEWMSEDLKFAALNGVHPTTGLVTSWSRYALRGILNIPCADDDGNGAMAKPDSRQQQRETAAKAHAQTPPAPIPPAQPDLIPTLTDESRPPVMLGDSWKKVICHVGETTKGKTVGELTRENWQYFGLEWQPKNKRDQIKNTKLINACNQALAANPAPETPAEAPATEVEPQLPPAKENPPEPPPVAEKPAMEWRSVVCTIGATKAVKNRTLGDIAISPRGEDPKVFDDGAGLLRMLIRDGVPFLKKKGEKATPAEKVLANAIAAAGAELNPFDNAEWLAEQKEDGLRAEISRRLTADGIDAERADAVFDSTYDKLAGCNEVQLRAIIGSWAKILPMMREGA